MKIFQTKLIHLQDCYKTCTGLDFRTKLISFGYDEKTFSVHYLAPRMYFLVGFRGKEKGFTNYIEIVDMLISDPQDRGKGWGTSIFSNFLMVARQSNYSKILLHPKNDSAKKFWEKFGFCDNRERNLSMELSLND